MSTARPTSSWTLPAGYSGRGFYGYEAPELLRQSTELRLRVWLEEATSMTDEYPDGRMEDAADPHSWHCAVLEPTGSMVASARMCMYEPEQLAERPWFAEVEHELVFPVSYWGRNVVLRAHRGLRLGAHLEQLRLAKSRELGAGCILADITPPRVARFERLGFEVLRPAEPGVRFPDKHWVHIIQYL